MRSNMNSPRRLLIFAALIGFAALSPRSADAAEGFQALNGTQLQRLFEDLQDVTFPVDGSSNYSDNYIFSFRSDGSWEGGPTFSVWGNWRVEGATLCVTIKDGDTEWSTPFEGCFSVSVNWTEGTIAGAFPDLKFDRFIMKKGAFSELASLQPAAPTAVAQAAAPRQAAADRQAAQNAAQKHDLEMQRLALERQRLESETELQKMQLEMERLRQQRAAPKQQARAVETDRTPPVIQSAANVETRAALITIEGRASDDTNLVRVELNGKRIDTSDGRFSISASVALGRNSMRLTAFDAQGNKAERIVTVTRERDIPEIAYGKYHALVIGINDYTGLPKLNTAIGDARTVAKTLEDLYGYSVTLLTNPSRADIIDAFDDLRDTLAEEDNLLIYYAGHGWLDQQTGRGYWLPVNAKADRRSRWISNATLTDALQGLLAKHVMVVADSCYSGTLTRSIKVPERNRAYLKRIAEKRARVVLSSGGLEPVSDSGGGKHSIFAAQFLKALKTNEGVLDGTQLFERVRQTVILNADQTPEYSDIRKAGHEGGDFLFVRRN